MSPILQTKTLTHTYSLGTPFEQAALRGVDFHVEPGELLGIIGHTGSGKSTLMQHLNGLIKPTEGQVYFDGTDIHESKETTRSVRAQVGLVFQYPEYQLFEETVYRDIAFGPKNMGLGGAEVDIRVREAAALVGLTTEQLDKSPFALSGGQKRRAAIAGVMAMRPRVLILDEPTAGLDPRGRDEIIGNIKAFHRETGAAVVLVSHSMEEIARTVSRVVVMSGGQIVMNGTGRSIFAQGAELHAMGLAVPEVTQIVMRLRTLGIDLPCDIFTVEQAAQAILTRAGGDTDAS
ncbi:MAG: energy-coupling factor transporter ATPase [Oscillospiraceae bacterium]|nr:energy-coupling factor transporter ATPase [Oscillospiraceae bacterium]